MGTSSLCVPLLKSERCRQILPAPLVKRATTRGAWGSSPKRTPVLRKYTDRLADAGIVKFHERSPEGRAAAVGRCLKFRCEPGLWGITLGRQPQPDSARRAHGSHGSRSRGRLCQVDVAGTGFASDETATQTSGLGTGHLMPHPEGTCARGTGVLQRDPIELDCTKCDIWRD